MPMTLRVYFVRALLAALLCTHAIAQLDGGEAGYSPRIDQHRFGLEADRILSPRDPRLVQPSGRGLTFEFHLTPSWGSSASADIVYCVAYVGGQRRIDRSEEATTTTAPVDLPVDPYAEPQSIPAAASETTEGPESVFWPRFALYLNSDHMLLHCGDRLLRSEMAARTKERLRNRQRVHFVLTVARGRVLVHADGRLCAQFKGIELASMDGVSPLPDHDIEQLVIGTLPNVPTGRLKLKQEVDGVVGVASAGYELDRWLRNLDGKVGGVRFWTRAFSENYVSDIGGRPRIALRGYEDVLRSIAFPRSRESDEPHYTDLVLYSDFGGAEPRRHHLELQFPLSGDWVNAGTESRIAEPPPGLDDSFGNVEVPSLISIVPTSSPDYWFVYENASLHGLLHFVAGAQEGTFRQSLTGEGDPVRVRLSNDELEFELPKAGRLFGGNDGRDSRLVTLRRPHLDWVGTAVDRDNPFWNSQQLAYIKVPFRAFDITAMDPLYAYQGKTGSARFIFDEPEANEYRLNSNKVVIPAAFHYCPIDRTSGSSKTTVVRSEREYADFYSQHSGFSVDTITYAQSDTKSSQWASSGASKGSNSMALSRSVLKKFALVLNRSQARLHPRFQAACHELADRLRSGESDTKTACRDFIASWGTHYAVGTVFGGMMVQERVLTESEIRSKWESLTSKDSTKAAGTRDGLGVGPIQVNLGKNEVGQSVGWTDSKGGGKMTSRDEGKVTYWAVPGEQLSVGEATSMPVSEPVPLFFDLRPLHQLLTPANFHDPFYYHDVRKALRAEIKSYVAEAGAKVKEGTEPENWIVETGEFQPAMRLRSAATESHVMGRLSYYPVGADHKIWKAGRRSSIQVEVAPTRKDELVHQVYALDHENGRKKEVNRFRLKNEHKRWILGRPVSMRRIKDNPNEPFFHFRLDGRIFIPQNKTWFPKVTRPTQMRAQTDPMMERAPMIPGTRAWQLWDNRSRSYITARALPAPGERKTRGFGLFIYPRDRKGITRLPRYWSHKHKREMTTPLPVLTIEAELELRTIKKSITPPDLGAKGLASYREHVARLAASTIAGDPARSDALRLDDDGDVWNLQIASLPDRRPLLQAYEKSLLQGALEAELASPLLEALKARGLPMGAFLLQDKGRSLGVAFEDTWIDLENGPIKALLCESDAPAVPAPVIVQDGRFVLALPLSSTRLELAQGKLGLQWSAPGQGEPVMVPESILARIPR